MRSVLPFAVALCALTAPAFAQTNTFNFTATGGGGGTLGSGVFQTTVVNGVDDITSVSGSGITGLISFNGADNVYYPGNSSPEGTYFDAKGFSFGDVQPGVHGATAYQVDIFSSSNGTYSAYLLDGDGDPAETVPVTLTITSPSTSVTPEPSSLILLGTGVLGAAGMVRRRMQKA